MFLLIELTFVAVPVAVLVFFLLSLWNYVSARYKNRQTPGLYPPAEMKTRLIKLIVWAAITAVMLAVIGGFIWLLATAIAYM